MSFTLRIADLTDSKLLSELGKICFFEAFGKDNTEADLKIYLEESFQESQINADLQNNDITFLIGMDEHNEAVGYAKLNRTEKPKELINYTSMQLQRIYVRQKTKGRKLGALMMEKCVEIAKNESVNFMWLAVWEENKSAIAFYVKWGFQICGHRFFKIGHKIDNDFMMRKEITL